MLSPCKYYEKYNYSNRKYLKIKINIPQVVYSGLPVIGIVAPSWCLFSTGVTWFGKCSKEGILPVYTSNSWLCARFNVVVLRILT